MEISFKRLLGDWVYFCVSVSGFHRYEKPKKGANGSDNTFTYVNHCSSFTSPPHWMIWRRAVDRRITGLLAWNCWVQGLEFSFTTSLLINGFHWHIFRLACRCPFDALIFYPRATAMAWDVRSHLKWRPNVVMRRYMVMRLWMMYRMVVEMRRMLLDHIVLWRMQMWASCCRRWRNVITTMSMRRC